MRALPRIVEDLRKERQARRRMTLTVLGIWLAGLALALLGIGPRADLSEANAYVVASILLPAVVGFTAVLWTQGPYPRPEAWLRRYVPPAFALTAVLILGIAGVPVRVYRSMDYWMCFWECLGATGLLTGLSAGVAFRHFAGVIRPTLWTRVGFVGGLAFLAMTVSQLCCGHPDAFHITLSHLLPGLPAVLIAAWSAHRHRALWALPPQGRA
jgi:hypothetical protein